MSSPAPILRVANTPLPADSVNPTWIGGGEDGRFGCESSLSAAPFLEMVVAQEKARNGNGCFILFWLWSFLNWDAQRLLPRNIFVAYQILESVEGKKRIYGTSWIELDT